MSGLILKINFDLCIVITLSQSVYFLNTKNLTLESLINKTWKDLADFRNISKQPSPVYPKLASFLFIAIETVTGYDPG